MQRKNDTKTMKTLSHYLIPITVLLTLAFSTLSNAATLSSTVNRNQVSTNETLTLTLAIDQQVNASELDLSALQKNFEILSATPQSRSSFSVINGKSENIVSTTWTITLVAKNEGLLTIPAFKVKSAMSKPISIKVSNTASGKSSSLPLDVWVSTSAKEVYPNQQFIVEVELSAATNVGDLNGSQLLIPNTEIEAFDQQNFQRVNNGITRQIVILKYSVFASQTGELIIPIMTYTGVENGQRSIFRSRGTQVTARSKQLKVIVKNKPTGNGQQWFPSDNVSITSRWSADASNLKVGEPITRTITITAKGQQASAIPPLKHGALEKGLKSYKDQAQLETSKSPQGFVATRIESEAIVANQAGDFILPKITIDWWNTKTKKWQTSTLDEQTLSVSGVAAPQNSPPEQFTGNDTTLKQSSNNDVNSIKLWQFISALLALIVLIQFYLLARRQNPKLDPIIDSRQLQSEQAAWAALQTAIKSDNNRAIRNNLLSWARAILKTSAPVSLNALVKAATLPDGSQELQQAFNDLDKHLYLGEQKPDNAKMNRHLKELRAALIKTNSRSAKSKPQLKPLYPS